MLDCKLEKAIIIGDIAQVKKLINEGCDYKAENNLAIRWSIIYGHIDLIKYLQELGVNINCKETKGIISDIEHNRLETIKYLVENGVDISCDDLTIAIENEENELIKYLFHKKPDYETLKEYVALEFSFDWLTESFYNDAEFSLCKELIKHIGCTNNDIFNNILKI